jgi:FKBP-type peptidyl-prolyl cis-trans isomerase FklB
MYTDSVRISYRGSLIPSASYADGYVFDQTFIGTFNWKTTAVINSLCSGFITGFTTALLHMHRGDRWRIYIPYQLGYGTDGSGSSVPGYSTLIFEIALIDFRPTTEAFPKWSARER